jgi:hypothetical protein
MGQHKISTFERIFTPTIGILALTASIVVIYFQFFHKEFLVNIIMNRSPVIEVSKVDVDLLFQNNGNVTTTILNCDLVVYQYPGDGRRGENKKPHDVYNWIMMHFDSTRVFIDPILLKPGEQKLKHISITIDHKRFNKYRTDYSKDFYVALAVEYTNTKGHVTQDVNYLYDYSIAILNEDTVLSGHIIPGPKTMRLYDEGNYYNNGMTKSLFDWEYGYQHDSMGRPVEPNPDSISRILNHDSLYQ